MFKSICKFTAIFLLSLSCQAVELDGAWSQGGLIVGRVDPGFQIEFMGKAVPVADDGLFVLGLGRDTRKQVELRVTSGSGEIESHQFAVDQRQYREQRVDGVPQKTVTPPPEVLQRISREAALVKRARADNDSRTDFLAGFARPLEGPITGVYGSRRVYNGTPGRPHYGLDIAAPMGTSVYAPAPGIVKLAHNDMYFSGGTLVVDHGHGLSSTFIHLSKLLVKQGDRIDTGDLIAQVGATGRATGPHLDWRMNWLDVRIDPALVMESFPRLEPVKQASSAF